MKLHQAILWKTTLRKTTWKCRSLNRSQGSIPRLLLNGTKKQDLSEADRNGSIITRVNSIGLHLKNLGNCVLISRFPPWIHVPTVQQRIENSVTAKRGVSADLPAVKI